MPNPGYYPNARLGLGDCTPQPFFFSFSFSSLHHTYHPIHPGLFCFFLSVFFPSCWSRDPQTSPTMPPLHSSPHHREKSNHYIPSHVPIMEGDAGRRYSGAQRHRHAHAENPIGTSTSTSPRSPHTPYPLPYHHHHHHLPKSHPQPPSITIDEQQPTRQRHSLPDVVVSPGPRSPAARTRFVSLPLSLLPLPRAEITESDRLERACGRVPAAFLRVPLRDDPPPSSPHQPRRNGASDAPMAPKWPHWTLVLRIKRVLRREGKDVRDYVEAAQIDEMFHRDVEERARRESEHARMARVRAGKEPESADFGDENTRWCLLFSWLWVELTCAQMCLVCR
jgi:hypothetical protein